jgi:hypothetical protein
LKPEEKLSNEGEEEDAYQNQPHPREHRQQPSACRLRANNRRGGGGGKARITGTRERNLSITITRNQSSTVLETRSGNFIITVGR